MDVGYIKMDIWINFYKDIANDAEKWFDTSNYDESDKRQQVKTKK